MKRTLALSIMVLTMVILEACSPRIYQSDSFDAALSRHKTVAILPAAVSISLRPNQLKKMTPEQMTEMSLREARDIQEKMYGWFLRRQDRFQYTVKFQDVTRTNSLLHSAGLNYADQDTYDRGKLAEILGVDAVIQVKAKMDKPMSEGAAVALGLLFGAWGATNRVETEINIHDGRTSDLLWKYNWVASGSVGSSTTQLVDALMRNAARKFPYNAR